MPNAYDDLMFGSTDLPEPIDPGTIPDLTEDDDPTKGYTYMTPPGLWVCNDCEAFVASIFAHTEWHARLDARFIDRYDSHVDGDDAAGHSEEASSPE